MDIHKKDFKSGLTGYNRDEVDEFLDQVVLDFERLYRENSEYKERTAIATEKVESYTTMEKTLQNTLVVAQSTADEVVKNAKDKAELILSTANEQAKKIVEDASKKITGLELEHEELKKRVQIFKTRFRTLLESELGALNDELKDF